MTLTPEQEQQIADELFKRVVPLFIDSLRRAGSEQAPITHGASNAT